MSWRRRNADDFTDEVRAHLEHEEAELRAAGMSAADARAEARRRFGNPARSVEDVRVARPLRLLDTLWQDVTFGVRLMRRSPAFSITAVVVLSLGIGINTALFSIVHALFFRPFPIADPGGLRYVYSKSVDRPETGRVIFGDLREAVRESGVFSDIAALSQITAKLRADGITELVNGEVVSPQYFQILGVVPAMGRAFVQADTDPSATTVAAVISDAFWKSKFQANPDVLGRTFEIDQSGVIGYSGPLQTFTVVGVMPPGFTGVGSRWWTAQFWRPIQIDPLNPRSGGGQSLVGRLAPGRTEYAAQSALEALSRQFQDGEPRWLLFLSRSDRSRLPFDPQGRIVPQQLAIGLLAVAGLVLVIAATNLAGVLAARSLTRQQEMAVRAALGAGHGRLRRQLVTENVVLSLAGGVPGVWLAYALVQLFLASTPGQFRFEQIALEVPVDWRALAFTGAACLTLGVVFGLLPARQATRPALLPALSAGSLHATRHARGRLRHGIVIPQIGLSLVLLLVAGTLVRTLLRADAVDPGYDATGVVVVDFDLPDPIRVDFGGVLPPGSRVFLNIDRPDSERLSDLRRRLLDRVQRVPDVEAASLIEPAILQRLPTEARPAWMIARESFPGGPRHWVGHSRGSHDFLRTLRIPLRQGRLFDARDRAGAPRVAIVNESAARLLWPGQPAVGQYVAENRPDSTRSPEWLEVVGVVGDVVSPLSPDWNPIVYTPFEQQTAFPTISVMMRTSGSVGETIARLRQELAMPDLGVNVIGGRSFDDILASILYPRRMAAGILALSGIVGLVLASIGLYGVISYSVAQREREVGIRAALGASRGAIAGWILREGAVVVALGALAGAALTFGATRLAAWLVAPLPAFDAATVGVVSAVVAAVVLLACYLPARRAARVDPVEVLRT